MPIAIIAAAGNGTRLQKDMPKAFVPIGAYPMLAYSLCTFATHPEIASIIIAIPPLLQDNFQSTIKHIAQQFPDTNITSVYGGKERGDSIAAALAIIPEIELHQILIHDAARPFIPSTIIDESISTLSHGALATIPVLPVVDTIKLCKTDGTIAETLPRELLVRAQTPQGFQGRVLHEAYKKNDPALFTDDASMVENMGIVVRTIRGSELSQKITNPIDLIWAENYAQENKIHLY